jgi:long-chain acyl-CoA synthetase
MTITNAEIDEIVRDRTVPSDFLETVAAHGDLTAIRWKNPDDSWGGWTFDDYAGLVARAAAGLAERGVRAGDRVVLMLRNIPQFHVLDMAVTFLGATPISIYNSSSPEQIAYLAGHCDAKLGFVEDSGFLRRFDTARKDLPDLSMLGVLHRDATTPDDVFDWDDLLADGSIELAEYSSHAKPDDLATLIYTSGTTGPPKGVMLSHYNIIWTVESLRAAVAEHPAFDHFAGKRVVSYLPMAHIAERMTSHYMQASLGYEVTCCPDPSEIGVFLTHARPNLVFGVPRVWEKLHSGLVSALSADTARHQQFEDGVAAATALVEKIDWDLATSEERDLWDFLQTAFAPIRDTLGLDQCDLAISGAAPIPAELLRWFRAIGIPLTEIYGMSESSGPMTYRAVRIKSGTVGIAIPGCEVVLADDGEVICRGGNVFIGYLDDKERTAEALDADGWLHSGDIGDIDDEGYLRIVDRKKELIITAGGKNISPANLEAALKLIPLVGQACAIGDQRPFVVALVVLDPEIAPAWARAQGIDFSNLADLAAHPEVTAEIEKHLDEVMASFNNAERVKKVHVLAEEWLPDSDVLTPTSKLKRRGIHARYESEIEALYR